MVFIKEMCADVISIDDNTLAQKFLFLENFAVTYDNDTLLFNTLCLRRYLQMQYLLMKTLVSGIKK